MTLSSIEFAVFFIITMAALRFSGPRSRYLLLVANYLFYASWNAGYLPIILLTTTVDFFLAREMSKSESARTRKLLLWTSLTFAFGLLIYFKYIFHLMNAVLYYSDSIERFEIPLIPIGLSFHTFQSMGYILDVYRRKIPAEKNFIDYANFVSFFPQLIAGPIERAADLIPQLKRMNFRPTYEATGKAFYLIFLGLFMAMGLGENLAPFAQSFFALNAPTSIEAGYFTKQSDYLISFYAFPFALYLRFAGYSLLAKGYALLLGIDLTTNFKYPFFSKNMTEFWSRWHISLSKWIRDYVFFPLSKNARSNADLYSYIFVTMWIFGLWHQASVGWILASTLLASYSVLVHALSGRARAAHSPIVTALGILVTFHVFALAMLLVNNFGYGQTLAEFRAGVLRFLSVEFIGADKLHIFHALILMTIALAIDAVNFAYRDIYGLLRLRLPYRVAAFSFMILFLFFELAPSKDLSLYFRM